MSSPEPRIVERAANHAVGLHEGLVITYAFRGTVDDPRHLTATADAMRREHERTGRPVRWMLVLAEAALSKPPSANVRAVAQRLLGQHEGLASKVAIVIAGEGFGPAIHRAVISGLTTLMRSTLRPLVVADARAGLTYLLEVHEPFELLLRFCERDLSRRGDRPQLDRT